MSYCRFSDGDLYMYASCRGGYQFMLANDAPAFNDRHEWNVGTASEAYKCLLELKASGYDIKEYAISRIKSEM